MVILVRVQASTWSLAEVCIYIHGNFLSDTHSYIRIYIVLILYILASPLSVVFYLLCAYSGHVTRGCAKTKTVVGTKGRRFVSTFLVVDLLSDHFHGRSVKNFCGLCFITSSSVSRPQPHLPSLANYGLSSYELII